jgi:replication factor A1
MINLGNVEKLKNKILEKKGDITEDELDRLIEEKKKSYSGFLSDEGAIRLIGYELSIFFNEENASPLGGEVFIGNLISGFNDVNVSGRIIAAWPTKNFVRKDGASGSFTRFVIADRTGIITCVAWNQDNPVLVEPGKLIGNLVKINHAYTKDNLGGEVELHIGDRGLIDFSPRDLDGDKYPKTEDLIQNISEIDEEKVRVNIRVIVKKDPVSSKFLKDDSERLVSRIMATDRTGEVTVVAWNDEAERLRELSPGDVIEVMNGKVKLGLNNSLEVHITKSSTIKFEREKDKPEKH